MEKKNYSKKEVETILMKYQWEYQGLESNKKIYEELGNPDITIDLNKNMDINDWFKLLGINKKLIVKRVIN